MPLQDDYQTEKELSDNAQEIAKAITEYIHDVEKNWGFVLFVFDFPTGTLQYISDMKREDNVRLLDFWVKRNTQ